jgi:ribose transport system substrate-binding protein
VSQIKKILNRFVRLPMRRESRLVLLLAGASLILALVITGVYRGKAMIDGGPESKPRIIIILKSVDYRLAFWQTVKDGVESACKDNGVDYSIVGPFSETQVDEQIKIIQDAIQARPDAIVLSATDYDRLVPVAKQVKEAHIPLITIDSFINSQDANTKIGTNNYDAGQKAATALMDHMQPGSQVVIMSYVQGSSTAMDRESGVRDYLKGKADILETLYSKGESEIAYEQARDLLRTHPNLKGIIALNDPTAIGAARAMDESGRKDEVTLIGFDNSLDVLQSVESGVIKDTIVQKPFNMGYLSISAAVDLIRGKSVQPYIDTGSKVINRQNMLLPENQKLLFPVNR